jgi:LacI family transcriptional regulator
LRAKNDKVFQQDMPMDTQQDGRKRGTRRSTAGPTVADVAREAGVSLMTVSRVVNGGDNVHEATREKVERAIAALGYVPNPAARSLAGARHCRIALLFSNPSAAYLSELLVGALAEATACNAELIVERWGDADTAAQLIRRLKAHRADAVLLPAPLCEKHTLLEALRADAIEIAQVAPGKPFSSVHAVTIDDIGAAHSITTHLIGLGHRRIGFIKGNPAQLQSEQRQIGYEQALIEAGLEIDRALIEPGDFTYRSGLVAAENLLSLDRPPTAIFASNDDMAAAVVSAAHRQHLDVPADLSVCGFDDTAMATIVWPELTTIRQPVAEMARTATSVLAKAVRSRRDGKLLGPQHHQLDYELVTRGSSASIFP